MNTSTSSATRMSSRMSVCSFENQRRRSVASASSAGMMPTVSLVAVLSSGPSSATVATGQPRNPFLALLLNPLRARSIIAAIRVAGGRYACP